MPQRTCSKGQVAAFPVGHMRGVLGHGLQVALGHERVQKAGMFMAQSLPHELPPSELGGGVIKLVSASLFSKTVITYGPSFMRYKAIYKQLLK